MQTPEPPSQEEIEVRRQIRRVLGQAPSYSGLTPVRQESLQRALDVLVSGAVGDSSRVVDFPVFVADLIQGTFQAIVDASIQQMEAYADLLDEATRAVDRFVAEAADKHEARERRKLLATMVLMGVNRIVIEDGKTRLRSVLADDGDDDE